MGVPSFYRWLVGKYPNIVAPAMEEEEDEPAVGHCSSKQQEAPYNGVVYHNLYLDMNGIIHPCFHPEDLQACPPTTFDEVFQSMFDYMDGLFRIVRPRRLLYLAVDGVAPRSKMNQQRARRFKNAKSDKDAEVEENLLREKFRAEGKAVLPKEASEVSDSNVITPGTEFMEKLSEALEHYIRDRLNTDPGWKDIKVILSDANVPGEGEHKIMSFIRAQRSMESYDPNTRHCLYGLDADLIMLALASHEVHFSILREDVSRPNQPENCVPITAENFTTQGLAKFKCRGWFPQLTESCPSGKSPNKKYKFLNIWVLREYLELEMKIHDPVFKPDIERLIDDFIFICFLMGNDFIPHIPSLEIHECAADLLIEVYKTTLNKMGGYIVNTDKVKDKHAAYLKVSRLEKFFHELSMCEEKIFLKRNELREKFQHNISRKAAENERREGNSDNLEESPDGPDLMAMSSSTQCSISTCSLDKSDITKNTLELRRNLKDTLRNKQDLFKNGACKHDRITKNTLELRRNLKDTLRNKQDLFKNGACKHDRIRLGLPGWKSRFYKEKFGVETSNEVGNLRNVMVQKYLEGLCWVFQYYFADVPSWSWYYPFYYAPFASDLKGLSRFKISFTVGKPLRPLDQLMAVLPPESSCALPKCYSKLMGCEESSIQKFYPSEVEIDTDGKRRFLWQLPFIDEKLLLSATKAVEKELAMHEMRRNTIRQDKIFLRNSNSLANNAAFVQTSDCSPQKLPIDSATSEIGGWLSPADDDGLSNGLLHSPIKKLQDITYDHAISAMFFNPEDVKTIPRLLDNVRIPNKTITEADISKRPLWHTYPGSKPPVMYNWQRSYSCKPDSLRKLLTPTTPREEFKSAGTGWMGRGRGNTTAVETKQIMSSSYGRGRGHAVAAEAQQRSSSFVRSFHGVDMAQTRGSRFDNGGAHGFRLEGAWAGRGTHEHGGALQKQQTAWRPVGSWARGGGGRNGGGRGGSGQPRAW